MRPCAQQFPESLRRGSHPDVAHWRFVEPVAQFQETNVIQTAEVPHVKGAADRVVCHGAENVTIAGSTERIGSGPQQR